MWQAGEVVSNLDALPAAIARAKELHASFLETQRRIANDALGGTDELGARRAAEEVLRILALSDARR